MSDPSIVAVLVVRARRGAFEHELETDLEPEIIEQILHDAANEVAGKNDRAKGAWGR